MDKRRSKSGLLIILAFAIWVLPEHCMGQSPATFESVVIDALDPDGWNGIVFLAKAFHQQRAPFAVRFGSRNGGFLDGEQIFNAVSEVGAHAPDASYCRMAWRHSTHDKPVSLEWSRLDQTTAVGRLTAPRDTELVLEAYFPRFSETHIPFAGPDFGTQGFYAVDPTHLAITGERYFDNVFGPTARFVVMVDRPLISSGAYAGPGQLREAMKRSGKLDPSHVADPTPGAAGLQFTTDGSKAHFVAVLGWDQASLMRRAEDLLGAGKIDTILKEKAEGYAARRPAVTGLFEGAPEAISNSMFWNAIYAPSLDSVFPGLSRHWDHDWGGWITGEWDAFFGSLLTSLEDKIQTRAHIKAILSTQIDSGLVQDGIGATGGAPDRTEEPVGAYMTWKVFEKTQDRELLEWAYPRLVKWHAWWLNDRGDGQPWRDGNRDGLLEYGSNRGSAASLGGRGYRKAAMWESGMDDSPMWDSIVYDPHTYTMNLDDVGLNSLYALDAECLSRIARILGKNNDAVKFAAEYEHMKKLIGEKLWNNEDGIYESRFWDGKFSKRLSPTNFYPMLAGIATPEQAKRMVNEHLLNPQEFWGTYVAPTIARNDPAFHDQFYWRGTIWGPTNYLLYEGITRYGFDKVAFEFAQKSYNLFMDDWRNNQHDNEQYHTWGGNGGGDTHYNWGALLCLVALEQYIDENPWEGLRFGALTPESSGEFRGAVWNGHRYDVVIGPGRTELIRDNKIRFEATGAVVVRNYQPAATRLKFTLEAEKDVSVTTAEFDSGEYRLKINGSTAGKISISQGRGQFDVPAGEHSVELLH